MQHIRALRSSALREGQRFTREVHGRTVTFIRHRGAVHALDSKCYHMGGPLGEAGDIEELAGDSVCIKCPWHGYRVSLETGGRVDTDLCGKTCTSAPKQRVYRVIDDGEHLWVLMDLTDSLASDHYNLVQQKQQPPPASLPSRGLGASFNLGGGFEARGLGSSSSPQQQQEPAAPSSASAPAVPEFLVPFGGLDKYYPAPSPVKPALAAPLAFRGRKANVRGELAREAVKKNYRPPPSSLGGPPMPRQQQQQHAPGTQLKVTELFGRHFAAQQQWAPPAAQTGPQDMDM